MAELLKLFWFARIVVLSSIYIYVGLDAPDLLFAASCGLLSQVLALLALKNKYTLLPSILLTGFFAICSVLVASTLFYFPIFTLSELTITLSFFSSVTASLVASTILDVVIYWRLSQSTRSSVSSNVSYKRLKPSV